MDDMWYVYGCENCGNSHVRMSDRKINRIKCLNNDCTGWMTIIEIKKTFWYKIKMWWKYGWGTWN